MTEYPETASAATVIVLNALTAQSKQLPYDEELIAYSTMFLAVGELVGRGVDVDLAMGIVQSALNHGDIHIRWADGEFSITIGGEW